MRDSMLRKPLLGGAFAGGEYELATQPIVANGLHAVRFSVIEPRAGRVLAIGDSKSEVLATARRVLTATGAANDEETRWVQQTLFRTSELALVPQPEPEPRPVSRRRREVFTRSNGRCFYCEQVLTLDGKWHVEHQRPRAIGGDDSPINLVAACEPCNLAKSDRTALEFIAQRPAA